MTSLADATPSRSTRVGATALARLCAVAGVILAGTSRAQFSDVTSGPLAFVGNGVGGAWGDYDNDGDLDLYIVAYGSESKLLRNDGGGLFSDVTTPVLIGVEFYKGAWWADYDNDGDLDLYRSTAIGASSLLRNDGGGVFVNVAAGALLNTDEHSGAAWGDYDNDGDLDLYQSKNNFPKQLLRNDGGDLFTDVTTSPLDDSGAGTGVVWVDYDDDGDPDLHLMLWGAQGKLFRNDGGGVFVDVTSGPFVSASYGESAAWGDYDNDGDLDVFLCNDFGSKLLRNDGAGVFVDVTSGPLGEDGFGLGLPPSASWGDYDNDGDLDLYSVRQGKPCRLFRNDGGGVFVDVTTGPLSGPTCATCFSTSVTVAASWGDYDNDGRLDLFLCNFGAGATPPSELLHNDDPSGNHWLGVRLVGTVSNRGGIGARVRVVAGGQSQIRDVSTAMGSQSESALSAHFGLGASTALTTLEVRWPSGIVQQVSPLPAVDQAVTVSELESVETQIADLSDAVQALVTGGALQPPALGASLQSKLNSALNLVTSGQTQGAIGVLKGFVSQVSSLIKTGKLTPAQGQPLIDAAQALIAQL